MKKLTILCATILLALTVVGLFPVHGEEKIYDSVVRLHVVANSDSDEDQKLKLAVRDAVAALTGEITSDGSTREEAVNALSGRLGDIQAAAEAVIAERGYDYPVEVRLGREDYPEKSYESICFPAGNYESLQVLIGEAAGKNWWCVLFPQLCLGAATRDAAEDAFIAVGLTPEQYKIVTETDDAKYRIRFKILEVIEDAVG